MAVDPSSSSSVPVAALSSSPSSPVNAKLDLKTWPSSEQHEPGPDGPGPGPGATAMATGTEASSSESVMGAAASTSAPSHVQQSQESSVLQNQPAGSVSHEQQSSSSTGRATYYPRHQQQHGHGHAQQHSHNYHGNHYGAGGAAAGPSSPSSSAHTNSSTVPTTRSPYPPNARLPRPSESFTRELSSVLQHSFLPSVLPTAEEYQIKESARKFLQSLADRIAPGAKLLPFGSQANGMALRNSDMDLCYIGPPGQPTRPASELVEVLGKLIEQEAPQFKVKMLPRARIPIIKLTMPKTQSNPHEISCDIGFENRLALENTRLLLTYAMADPRLRTIVLFLKVWSKRRKINNPYLGTLSSYGYVLLVIHYLINVRKPGVLPNLQRLQPPNPRQLGQAEFEGRDIYFFDDLELLPRHWQPCNRDSVGELLVGFFHYYHKEFRYTFDVVSIRTEGGILSKAQKGWQVDEKPREEFNIPRDMNRLCIEDPFQTEYNVARTVTVDGLFTIRGEIARAASILRGARSEHSATTLIAELVEEREDYLIQAPAPGSSNRRRSAPSPRLQPTVMATHNDFRAWAMANGVPYAPGSAVHSHQMQSVPLIASQGPQHQPQGDTSALAVSSTNTVNGSSGNSTPAGTGGGTSVPGLLGSPLTNAASMQASPSDALLRFQQASQALSQANLQQHQALATAQLGSPNQQQLLASLPALLAATNLRNYRPPRHQNRYQPEHSGGGGQGYRQYRHSQFSQHSHHQYQSYRSGMSSPTASSSTAFLQPYPPPPASTSSASAAMSSAGAGQQHLNLSRSTIASGSRNLNAPTLERRSSWDGSAAGQSNLHQAYRGSSSLSEAGAGDLGVVATAPTSPTMPGIHVQGFPGPAMGFEGLPTQFESAGVDANGSYSPQSSTSVSAPSHFTDASMNGQNFREYRQPRRPYARNAQPHWQGQQHAANLQGAQHRGQFQNRYRYDHNIAQPPQHQQYQPFQAAAGLTNALGMSDDLNSLPTINGDVVQESHTQQAHHSTANSLSQSTSISLPERSLQSLAASSATNSIPPSVADSLHPSDLSDVINGSHASSSEDGDDEIPAPGSIQFGNFDAAFYSSEPAEMAGLGLFDGIPGIDSPAASASDQSFDKSMSIPDDAMLPPPVHPAQHNSAERSANVQTGNLPVTSSQSSSSGVVNGRPIPIPHFSRSSMLRFQPALADIPASPAAKRSIPGSPNLDRRPSMHNRRRSAGDEIALASSDVTFFGDVPVSKDERERKQALAALLKETSAASAAGNNYTSSKASSSASGGSVGDQAAPMTATGAVSSNNVNVGTSFAGRRTSVSSSTTTNDSSSLARPRADLPSSSASATSMSTSASRQETSPEHDHTPQSGGASDGSSLTTSVRAEDRSTPVPPTKQSPPSDPLTATTTKKKQSQQQQQKGSPVPTIPVAGQSDAANLRQSPASPRSTTTSPSARKQSLTYSASVTSTPASSQSGKSRSGKKT